MSSLAEETHGFRLIVAELLNVIFPGQCPGIEQNAETLPVLVETPLSNLNRKSFQDPPFQVLRHPSNKRRMFLK